MSAETPLSVAPEGATDSRGGRSRLRTRLLLLGVGGASILLVIALGVGMATGVGGRPIGAVDPGFKVAADFTLPAFNGQPFTLSDHASGPVFLYFWASWCVPCRTEAPIISALWPEYQARGYTFVGVNILDAEKDARDFIQTYQLNFPLVYDPDGEAYLEYGVYGVPEAFFLRPALRVHEKFLGPLSEQQLRGKLDELSRSP